MPSAKVVSLRVRPSQVSHLCFEVGGILGETHTELGAAIGAFDLNGFYPDLGTTFVPHIYSSEIGIFDLSRLYYDSKGIQDFAKPFALAALRAEARKAVLDKAVNVRQNTYFAKYANAPAIISRMNEFYSPTVGTSKPNRLDTLSNISLGQTEAQVNAYQTEKPPRTGVVKTGNSVLDSTLGSSGTSTTAGKRAENSVSWAAPPGTYTAPPPVIVPAFDGISPAPLPSGGYDQVSAAPAGPEWANQDEQMESSGESSNSTGSATQHQTIVSSDYGYRVPYLENLAQGHRAQISLMDERFTQFMNTQNLPHLATVFQNELSSMDRDVYRLQIDYMNTILMSPISGTVTGIYKNPGDSVRAGEPVMRVENNSDILLVATLVYRGRISIASMVTVQTKLFDLPDPAPPTPPPLHGAIYGRVHDDLTTVSGNVVSVRGQQEDDHWEVIIKCSNLDSGGTPIFPLGYHFDYDDTTVSII